MSAYRIGALFIVHILSLYSLFFFLTDRSRTHPPEMFCIFGIYKRDTKTTEVSVRESEGSKGPRAEIRAMGPAEGKATGSPMALSEDIQSDMSSDMDSDDTDYDGMYSDGTDSDVMGSDGEGSDDSSSEDEEPSPEGNTWSSSRKNKLRIPSLAEICLRSQSQRDRIQADGDTAVITPRHEHHEWHLIRQAETLPAHSSIGTGSYEASSPGVNPQA